MDLFVVRRSNLPLNESYNIVNKLRSEAVESERIPNLSLNLLGAFFKTLHLKFIVKKPGSNDWDGKGINLKDFEGCYYKTSKSDAIILNANKLHNMPIPFKAINSKVNRERIGKLPFEPNQNNELQGSGVARFIHSPTNLNYWHIELNVIDFNDKVIKKNSSEFDGFACDFIHDFISEHAFIKMPRNISYKIKKEDFFIN
jgi:hypothetical protein